jgi:hypothetical protein
VEALPLVVQMSAWSRLAEAYVDADSLELRGVPTLVVPVELPQLGRRFRVYAGPLPEPASAESLLSRLRRAGWLRSDEGMTVTAPLSFALAGGLSPDSALVERERLRAAGLPTFVLGQPDGTYRLFAGAYESPAQAAVLRTFLTSTGSAGELVPRAGFVP